MRLANGLVVDTEKTFGMTKFSAMRREVFVENEDGTVTTEVKERTYDIKSKAQGMMIQVSVPADVPLKEFDYDAEVIIVNPMLGAIATKTYFGADVEWYMKADDIILKDSKDNAGQKVPEGQPGGQKGPGGQSQEERKTPDGQPRGEQKGSEGQQKNK